MSDNEGQQDVPDKSRSPPPDSNGQQPEQASENAADGHDTTADEDGGVKVHDERGEGEDTCASNSKESGETITAGGAGEEGGGQPEHGKGSPPPPPPAQAGENAEEARDLSTETASTDASTEFAESESPDGPPVPGAATAPDTTPASPPDASGPVVPPAEQNSTGPPKVPSAVPEYTTTAAPTQPDESIQSDDEHYKAAAEERETCDDTPSDEPPPGEDQTAETAPEGHAGSEEKVANELQQEHVKVPDEDTKSEAFVDADDGELPGEAGTQTTTEPPPPPPPEQPPQEPQPPTIMSAVSSVSALSDRPDLASVLPAQYAEDSYPNTSFAAGPLDDEAAAAAGAAALEMAAAEAPDAGRREKKERSHRKKERSGDGTERVKEKKHREKGDREREQAKSRDRGSRVRDRSAHLDSVERTRDRSAHLDNGERTRDREHRVRTKSRDRLSDPKDRDKAEKKHRTPEEKAEREARKAAKRSGTTPAPMFADNITVEPNEQQFDAQYDQQYEEERHADEKRKHKKLSKRSTPAPMFVEPVIVDPIEPPYDQAAQEGIREKKKSKKARPPPITIEPHAQPYDPEQQTEELIKRRKSSKSKAAALLGQPITSAMEGHQGPPLSPYIDGPIEQPKRKKSSKKPKEEGVEIEPVHVVYEPEAQPPKATRRSRSDSVKPPGEQSNDKDKKHSSTHRRKDSAHLTPEEREERRRKHEEKALRKGKELEDHLRNGSKEERRAEKAARKAAKAKAEAREGIPPPPMAPYDLPIQNPSDSPVLQQNAHDGSQLRSPYLHRDQQDGVLNSPRREHHEAPMSPRSFVGDEEAVKAEKARRRAERRARKEQEKETEVVKDSGHSLSSEGKREHREHSKKHKSSRAHSKTRLPLTAEEEEARRIRKEEKREARRQAALEGEAIAKPEGKVRKQRDSGGRVRSGSERHSKEKDMYREMEIGMPVGYGNNSQTPWAAGTQQVEEEEKRGFMRRTFAKVLKF